MRQWLFFVCDGSSNSKLYGIFERGIYVYSLKLTQKTRLFQYEVVMHEYFRQQQLLNVTLGHYVDETDACTTEPTRVLWLEQWKSSVRG